MLVFISIPSKDDEEFSRMDGSLHIAIFVGCAVGYAVATTMFGVVSAGTTSVLILFARNRDILSMHHGRAFDRLEGAWTMAYPHEYKASQQVLDSDSEFGSV